MKPITIYIDDSIEKAMEDELGEKSDMWDLLSPHAVVAALAMAISGGGGK